MCGRYVIISTLEKVEKRFEVKANNASEFGMSVNVALGEYAPIITNTDPQQLQFFRFGFTPTWADKATYLINARSEGKFNKENQMDYNGSKGILQKPMFKQAIRQQRCLVIADAFLEGPQKERLSKPYVVYPQNQASPFAMAGIWSTWYNPKIEAEESTFAILTTAANSLLAKIGHHRAPLILNPEDEKLWLDKGAKLSDVTSLMKPFDPKLFNAYPIDPAIKKVKNKDPQLLQPIGQRVVPEYQYEIYKELVVRGMGQTRARIRKEKDEGTQGLLF
ncbi:MAG: putative SOS response-associated peptidase YedK [Chitinophagales bacterium]|jgi:putative SOS response-associated peptidase YedK